MTYPPPEQPQDPQYPWGGQPPVGPPRPGETYGAQYWPAPPPGGALTPSQERTWASAAHWGALVVAVFGGLLTVLLALAWFAVPLIIRSTQGSRSAYVRAHATEALNFTITWTIFGLIAIIGGSLIGLLTLGLGLIVVVPVWLAMALFEIVVMIIAAVRAGGGQHYRYPLSIRFVS